MVSTEIDWIDEIPEGWGSCKIKNISKVEEMKKRLMREVRIFSFRKNGFI